MSLCPNCNKEGPHFVPPSLGERGFYICDASVNVIGSSTIDSLDFAKLQELVKEADRLQAQADAILKPLIPPTVSAMDTLISGLRRSLRENQQLELGKLTKGNYTGDQLHELMDKHTGERRVLQTGIDRLWKQFRTRAIV